jgi:hypothetical protein
MVSQLSQFFFHPFNVPRRTLQNNEGYSLKDFNKMETPNPTIITSVKHKTGIKVFAPASVANVACGFDVLGFALEAPGDEIIVRFSDTKGLRITKVTGGKLPLEIERNTAGFAALKLLNAFWKWFRVECCKCCWCCFCHK